MTSNAALKTEAPELVRKMIDLGWATRPTGPSLTQLSASSLTNRIRRGQLDRPLICGGLRLRHKWDHARGECRWCGIAKPGGQP